MKKYNGFVETNYYNQLIKSRFNSNKFTFKENEFCPYNLKLSEDYAASTLQPLNQEVSQLNTVPFYSFTPTINTHLQVI